MIFLKTDTNTVCLSPHHYFKIEDISKTDPYIKCLLTQQEAIPYLNVFQMNTSKTPCNLCNSLGESVNSVRART
jgi:hypothetical protein